MKISQLAVLAQVLDIQMQIAKIMVLNITKWIT